MYRRNQLRSFAMAALFAVLAPSAALAGDDFTIVTRLSTATGEPVVSTHYLSATKIRTAENQLEVIVDLESGVMTHVDHRRRQYFTTHAAQLADHFADIEALARSNPILSRLLADTGTVVVGKIERERQIIGRPCQQRGLELGAEFEIDVCSGPDLPVPGAFYDARKLLWANIGPMSILFAKSFDAMKQLDGFPLMVNTNSTVPGLEMMTRQQVTEIEPQIPADAFTVPADYEEIHSPYE